MSSRPDALQPFLNPIAKLLRSLWLLAQKRPILGSVGRKGFNAKPVSQEGISQILRFRSELTPSKSYRYQALLLA